MRDEMGILIRLTGLVSVWYPIFPLKGWATFLTGVLHFSHQTVYRNSRLPTDQQDFLLPGPSRSRAYGLEAWKQNSKASSLNTNRSRFLQNDFALVPFELIITVYDHPSRLNYSQSVNTDASAMPSCGPFMVLRRIPVLIED